jgi:hypothetical protein
VNEFTLRNKTKQPIMTLTKPMLAKLLTAHPESVSMVLAKQVKEYRALTGKTLMLDHEQDLILRAHAGADERGTTCRPSRGARRVGWRGGGGGPASTTTCPTHSTT